MTDEMARIGALLERLGIGSDPTVMDEVQEWLVANVARDAMAEYLEALGEIVMDREGGPGAPGAGWTLGNDDLDMESPGGNRDGSGA